MDHQPMSPKTLHMPGWMDEELRILAFVTKLPKQELMRRMIGQGLATAWNELEQKASLSISEQPLLERAEIHPKAQKAIAQHHNS